MFNTSYAYIWRRLVEPGFEVLRGKKTPRITNIVNETQYFSLEKLRNLQWSHLARLLDHASENVPFYRRFFREAGIAPKDIIAQRDMSPLPVITRDMLIDNLEDFTSIVLTAEFL